MVYKGVDIFYCKFFAIRKPGTGKGLRIIAKKYRDKTSDDFNTIEEIDKIIAYCFWIIKKGDTPIYSKFAAMCFINELKPKLSELEKKIGEVAIKKQEELKKKTKESIKEPGTRYANR